MKPVLLWSDALIFMLVIALLLAVHLSRMAARLRRDLNAAD